MLWCSLESPHRGDRWGDSNEYPQHKFLWRTDEIYPSIIIKYPPYLFHHILQCLIWSTLFAKVLLMGHMPWLGWLG